MCVKLENAGKIIIPGTRTLIKTSGLLKYMRWGVDLGHGVISNARIESVVAGLWNKWGLTHIGELEVDAFFESTSSKSYRFHLPDPIQVSVLHNDRNFLVITEPANSLVKQYHSRQPCYERKLVAA